MAKYRVLYVFLLVLALFFALGYSGHLSLCILITVAVFPILSLIFLVVSALLISVSSDTLEKSYHKHDDFRAIIRIKNRSPFPVASAVIHSKLPSIDPKAYNTELVFSLAPFRTRKLPLTYRLGFRGLYRFECSEIELYDLLKIFRIRKKLKISADVSVLPRHILLDNTHSGPIGETDSPLLMINDANGSEQSFVREYRETDSLRQMHWKLSAKHDNYMIRQMATAVSKGTAIFCDFYAYSGDIVRDADYADTACEAAIALSYNAIINGEEALNIWYNGAEKREECALASNEADFSRLFHTYARTNIYSGGELFEKIVRSFSEQLSARATVIFITPVVTRELLSLVEGISALVPRTAIVEVGGLTGENIKNELALSPKIKFCELYGRDAARELLQLTSADWRKK